LVIFDTCVSRSLRSAVERERRRAAEAEEQRRAAVEAMGRQGRPTLPLSWAEMKMDFPETFISSYPVESGSVG